MSIPSSTTSPLTRAVGTVSCIRLRHRSNVDLPQPDGPMIAVTSRSGKSNDTLRTACVLPKNASSLPTARATRAARSAACALGVLGRFSRNATAGEATGPTPLTPVVVAGCVIVLIPAPGAELAAGGEPGDEADDEDEGDEDEGAGPGLGVPFVVGADRIGVNLKGKGRNRLIQRCRPELIAECREQERGRLAGDPRDCHERASDDAGAGGPQHDGERGPPPRIAECQGRLSQRDRNEARPLLGRAR